MAIHLVNPGNHSFGVAMITPRWLYVLAGATPRELGSPELVDETLQPIVLDRIAPGDVVGIGIHTSNALRGYEIGRATRERGAHVVFGGIHATLFPDEAFEHGAAHSVVTGDGEVAWGQLLRDYTGGEAKRVYEGGRLPAEALSPARWDLLPAGRYLGGCVQTVRGCPKHCSFCSVWRTDGQKPRQRAHEAIVEEIFALRRLGIRFILLADDNFYPVTLADLAAAEARGDMAKLDELRALRRERFDLLDAMTALPPDMMFFTQITMEAAEDPRFLTAMSRAGIKFALVGVESVSPQGLRAIRKDFNDAGDALVERLRIFPQHGVHLLGSFIFGLPTDTAEVFAATSDVVDRSAVAVAQFLRLTPFPGTVDFAAWERRVRADPDADQRMTRYWLIPYADRPKVQMAHPVLSAADILSHTVAAWRRFYKLPAIWRRSRIMSSWQGRLMFVLGSKLFAQMYFQTGIASDSARASRASWWSGRLALVARRLMEWHAALSPGT